MDKYVIKYDPEGKGSKFYHDLYGYSKGEYSYPGLVDRLRRIRRYSDSTLLVEGDDVKEAVKSFLESEEVPFEVMKVLPEKSGGRSRERGILTWTMSLEEIVEGVRGAFDETMNLSGSIRTKDVRSAVEDTERFGY